MAAILDQPKTRGPRTPAPVFCYACGNEIGPSQERFVYELKNGTYPSGTMTKIQFHYEHRPQRD